jgi:hypothetical protein
MATDPTFDGTGLRVLTLQEIRDNQREFIRLSPAIGPNVSTGPYSIAGMLLDAAAPELADIYDLDAAIYQGWDPDSAEGAQFDNLGTLAGLTRQAATRSTGTLTLTGTPTTVIPALSKAKIPNGESVRTTAEATIPGGGSIDVAAEAVNTGPLDFGIGSVTEIVDAVAGWTGVTNAAEFDIGSDQESDSEFRARRSRSLSAGGSSTDAAIRARLEDLDDVEAAAVYSNRTLVTDGNGVPGKSVWIIVDPDTVDPVTIATTIWGPAGLPAGIASFGAQSGTITDDRGFTQQVYWDWATEVRVWVTCTLTMNSSYPGYPGGAAGDALVAQAVVDWAASALNLAGAVEPQPIDTFVALAVPGIAKLVITLSRLGVPGGGDTDPIPMAINERATIALGDVLVVST